MNQNKKTITEIRRKIRLAKGALQEDEDALECLEDSISLQKLFISELEQEIKLLLNKSKNDII